MSALKPPLPSTRFPAVRAAEGGHNLLTSPSPGEHELLRMTGAGLFLAATVKAQGAGADQVNVSVDLDGRNLFTVTYGALRTNGQTQANPTPLMLAGAGEVRSMMIGFPYPLRYDKEVRISVLVRTPDITQVMATLWHGHD